mgnify:CR=1 FL=1
MCLGHRINSDLLEIRKVPEIKRYRLDIEGFEESTEKKVAAGSKGSVEGVFFLLS